MCLVLTWPHSPGLLTLILEDSKSNVLFLTILYMNLHFDLILPLPLPQELLSFSSGHVLPTLTSLLSLLMTHCLVGVFGTCTGKRLFYWIMGKLPVVTSWRKMTPLPNWRSQEMSQGSLQKGIDNLCGVGCRSVWLCRITGCLKVQRILYGDFVFGLGKFLIPAKPLCFLGYNEKRYKFWGWFLMPGLVFNSVK